VDLCTATTLFDVKAPWGAEEGIVVSRWTTHGTELEMVIETQLDTSSDHNFTCDIQNLDTFTCSSDTRMRLAHEFHGHLSTPPKHLFGHEKKQPKQIQRTHIPKLQLQSHLKRPQRRPQQHSHRSNLPRRHSLRGRRARLASMAMRDPLSCSIDLLRFHRNAIRKFIRDFRVVIHIYIGI